MLAAGKFDVEFDRRLRRERDFGFDDGFADGLHGFGVAAKIEIEVAANVVERDGDEQVVDVVAAEMRVAVGGDDFENAVMQLEDGNVEGAAAEVVDRDDAVLFLVEAVGERRGGWFVDQAQDFEAGDAAGVFCGLTLCVVEIRRNGDDRFRDRAAEETLGAAFELAKNERGNFWRSERLVAEFDSEHFSGLHVFGEAEGEEFQFFLNVFDAASHEAFDGVDGALRRFDQRITRSVADDGLVVRVERDYRREQVQTVVSGDHDRGVPLHECHQRVGGAEVDADDAISSHLGHFQFSEFSC
jgi:hypothetical protein